MNRIFQTSVLLQYVIIPKFIWPFFYIMHEGVNRYIPDCFLSFLLIYFHEWFPLKRMISNGEIYCFSFGSLSISEMKHEVTLYQSILSGKFSISYSLKISKSQTFFRSSKNGTLSCNGLLKLLEWRREAKLPGLRYITQICNTYYSVFLNLSNNHDGVFCDDT